MIDRATATTTADAESTWQALTRVASWPRWTASITAVVALDGGDDYPRLRRRFRVTQPRLRPLTWEVTEIRDGESFTWRSTMPGLTLVGRHCIDVQPDGTTTIHNSLEQRGPTALVVRALAGRRIRRYLEMEVVGLAKASQTGGADPLSP